MGELSWGVSCGGEAVINNVRKSIKAAIQSQCFQRYLTDSRGWGAEVVGPQVAERWRSKLKHMRDLAGATVLPVHPFLITKIKRMIVKVKDTCRRRLSRFLECHEPLKGFYLYQLMCYLLKNRPS